MRKLILTAILWGISTAGATTMSWESDIGAESTWSRLTYAGTLLAATEGTLLHFDAETGEILWRRDDLKKLAQFNVNDVPGTPFLIISERVGNVPPKSHLQVLNISTGETLWDTGEVAGAGLGAFPVPEKDLLVFAADLHGKKPGNYVTGYTMSTGEQLWQVKLGSVGTMQLHPSDISGFIPTTDLSGHPPPLVVDNTMYISAGTLFAINLEDGSEIWRAKIKSSNPSLKNTYAQPLHVDGTLYAASRDSVYALNAATGEELWRAKVGKAAIPQLTMAGDRLVGRLGGTFSNGKDLASLKPFGAFSIDTTTGKVQWKWTKAKDSVTNMHVIEDRGLVVLADKKKLCGLDLDASKKGNIAFSHELEFKRKMGNADLAAKGIGAAGGFLSGGLTGGLKGLAGGGDRGDPPLDISFIEGRAIIRAQYHVLAYNLETRETDWSIQFAPPGMSSFALIAMGAVTATVAAGNAAGARTSSSWATSNAYANSALSVTNAFQDVAAKRYAAAEKARTIAFFLTKEEEEGMVLMGIDLATGDEVGRIAMNDKEPQFMVDDIANRVYYFKDKMTIEAHDF